MGSLNYLHSKYIRRAKHWANSCQVRRGEKDVRMNKTEDTDLPQPFLLSKGFTVCLGNQPGFKRYEAERRRELSELQTGALSFQTPAQGC